MTKAEFYTMNIIWKKKASREQIPHSVGTDFLPDKGLKGFRDQTLMPNTGYASNKKPAQAAGGFWKFLIPKVKELKVLLMCNKSHCAGIAHNVPSGWEEQPAGHQSHQYPVPGCAAKKMRQLCAHCICTNKTIKFCHPAKKK